MSVSKETKAQLISENARSESDSGSVEVQVAILTTRIKNLTEHLKIHRKDKSTTRGLLGLVARRRKLLRYLRRIHFSRYTALVNKLEIRH